MPKFHVSTLAKMSEPQRTRALALVVAHATGGTALLAESEGPDISIIQWWGQSLSHDNSKNEPHL